MALLIKCVYYTLYYYRSGSSLAGSYFPILLKTLCRDKCLFLLFSGDSVSHYETIKMVDNFFSAYLSSLVWLSSHATLQSPLRLLGAVTDGERLRRYYTTPVSFRELKWVELGVDTHSDSSTATKVLEELFQLMKGVVLLPLPDTTKDSLCQYILSTHNLVEREEESLKYSKSLLLNLIYHQQQQLTILLKETCCQKGVDSNDTYRQLVSTMNFLLTSCTDITCWTCPLINTLLSSSTGVTCFGFLFNLLNRFCQGGDVKNRGEKGSREEIEYKRLVEFITEGELKITISYY